VGLSDFCIEPVSPLEASLKRAVDASIAVLILVLASPLLAVIALLVKLDSRGSIFFRGVRTGRNGVPFRIYKFRTMVVNAENLGGSTTRLDDPRVTNVGAFLRRWKLDELPQLLNVLNGEMSLVGPRPEMQEYTTLYSEEERAILSVRPGITDYASIQFVDLASRVGAGDADTEYRLHVLHEKNRLRLQYVREQSLLGDVKIIWRTMRAVISRSRQWST
jgi:lipopolysaccharide/colanic/teichoic acid biosynthesis glycosyltransferase